MRHTHSRRTHAGARKHDNRSNTMADATEIANQLASAVELVQSASGELESLTEQDPKADEAQQLCADALTKLEEASEIVAGMTGAPPETENVELSAKRAWSRDAALRAEFRGRFGAYVAWRKANAQGRVRIAGQRRSIR